MQIFISWSGQISYQLALLLRDLIRLVLPGLEPWVSSEDIVDGSRWSPDLIRILDQTTFGIICADPSNHTSNWLHFELGALAKSIEKWNIKVFLYELKPGELRGPLTLYQPVKIEKREVARLMEDIQANFTQISVTQEEMAANLNKQWPGFYTKVAQINVDTTLSSDSQQQENLSEKASLVAMGYIDEVSEKILALLCVNESIDEDKISTTVYLPRGDTLKHLIELEKKNLVWSKMIFGTRRWYITDLGRKFLPGIYQDQIS
jgi:hypothetical protein